MAPNNSGRTALGISQWAPGGYLSLRVGVMQFIQRLSLKFRSRRDAARSIAEAGRYLMGHVGITGHVECLLSCDAHDRHGFVLRLNTFQRIPHSAREEIQHYFRRKLTQLGELQGAPLLLWIQDADDQSYASQANRSVSSGRVASVVSARRPFHWSVSASKGAVAGFWLAQPAIKNAANSAPRKRRRITCPS